MLRCTAPSLHHACLKKALENPHLMDAETEVTRVKYISKGTELAGLELGLSNCDFTMLTADLTAPARTGSGMLFTEIAVCSGNPIWVRIL